MASIPLPALAIKPPEQQNALALLQGVQGIRAGQQEQQQRSIQIQNAQMQQKDQVTLRGLFIKHQGNLDKVIEEAPQAGVSPATIQQMQLHNIDVKTKTADLVKANSANAQTQADLMQGAHDTVDKAPAEQRPAIYQQQLQSLQQRGIDVSQMPPQYPGDDQFKLLGAIVKGHSQQVAEAMKEREVSAQEMTAQGRKEQGDAALAKNAPLPQAQIGFLNKQLQNRYQVLNPGQQLPPEYTVQQGANRQNFEDISSSLEKLEAAATARANRAQQQQQQSGTRADMRSEKSYQFNSSQLEKVAAPVDQAISRMGRLQDALAQGTPQADALIAPELLSVMAGGAGSGLRMNEAEIARIVGGRSKWESLQASINQWKLDPEKANSITPDQRQQIRALVTEVDNKLKAKQGALDEARQGLINSDDPAEHKRIVVNARNKMSTIDQGAGQPQGGTVMMKAPNGQTKPVPADQVEHYKSLGAVPVNQ